MEGLKTSNEGGMGKKIKEGLQAAVAATALFAASPAEKAEAADSARQATCNIETVGQEGKTRQERYQAIVQRIARDPMQFKIDLFGKGIELTTRAQESQVDRWKSVNTKEDHIDPNWKKVFNEARRATNAGMSVVADFNLTQEILSTFNQEESDHLNTLQEEMKRVRKIQDELVQARVQQPINGDYIQRLGDELVMSQGIIERLTNILAQKLQNACEANMPTSR